MNNRRQWRNERVPGPVDPVLLAEGAARDACVQIARPAAKAIGVRFGSVDVVQTGGAWRILKINSGVMMEALGKRHPELVEALYTAALDKAFEGA